MVTNWNTLNYNEKMIANGYCFLHITTASCIIMWSEHSIPANISITQAWTDNQTENGLTMDHQLLNMWMEEGYLFSQTTGKTLECTKSNSPLTSNFWLLSCEPLQQWKEQWNRPVLGNTKVHHSARGKRLGLKRTNKLTNHLKMKRYGDGVKRPVN